MAGRFTLSYRDFDGELKQSSFYIVSPASDGSNLATWNANLNGLRDAITAVSGGVMARDARTATETDGSTARAANPSSQAHYRAIIEYVDDETAKVFRDMFIPVPKISDEALWETIGGVTRLILDVGAGQDFVTEFEAHARSAAGNTVTVQQIYLERS